VVLAACTSTPTNDPQLDVVPGPWFVGESNAVAVEWPPDVTCDPQRTWDCSSGPTPSFAVTNVTCEGCTTSGVQLGQEVEGAQKFSFVATTTEAIVLTVETTDGHTLVASGMGDRELALVVDCGVIWSAQLGDTDFLPRPCGATRQPDEIVMLSPRITTMRGAQRFPFCPDGAVGCNPADTRKTSQIIATPAQDSWKFDALVYSTPSAATVTIQAPLADGTISTASVAIPPVR
jgi:hypothetical protein